MDDQSRLLAELESMLLGGERRYTRSQVAEQVGVPLERAVRLWRAMGFASVPDDELVFGDDDVEALRLMVSLVDAGVVAPEAEASLSRALGQTMARLAEWQTRVVRDVVAGPDEAVPPDAVRVAGALVPLMERLQSYVWRRHLLAAAGRLFSAPETLGSRLVVGFADIVGFTSYSRTVDDRRLAELIERFEAVAVEIIAQDHGRVVKTIGDEVLFAAADPAAAARVALRLAHRSATDVEFPALRVGLAYGRVLSRLGDVYGPVVNVASRLTSLARPGTVLVDRELAAALRAEPEFDLRRVRKVAVRGYARLEPWALRAAKGRPES